MKVGIVGLGVVGGTLAQWVQKHTSNQVCGWDPGKGIRDDFFGVDLICVAVPVLTLPNRTQDLGEIVKTIVRFQFLKVPFYIRSTVLPGTCDKLANEFGVPVFAMPEFLTERTASEDFDEQGVICGYDPKAPYEVAARRMRDVREMFNYGRLREPKECLFVRNVEAELGKYAHNVMGALKVNFFNLIYEVAHKHTAQYENVVNVVCSSGYIDRTHTQVPGPDGKFGYGGKCFPKDLQAFIGHLRELQLPDVGLRAVEEFNAQIRDGLGGEIGNGQ